MENLRRLAALYAGDTRISQIVDYIQEHGLNGQVMLKNVVGAQTSFVLSGLLSRGIRNHLIITADREEAAYLQNSSENICVDHEVSFLPDSFKRPRQFEEIDPHHVLQRTEAINRISDNRNGEVVITYPEALFEKVLDPRIIREHKLEFTKNERIDLDTILDLLVDYGFERVDFVYEPGQFSIRGGIVDIFSFGNEWPYRVELFDDEVESIRTFNPINQISIRAIEKVSIIPNLVGEFGSKDKVSVFDVLPDDTIVWVRDLDQIVDTLQDCFEKAESFAKNVSLLDDEKVHDLFKERSFIYPADVLSYIERFSRITLAKQPSQGDNLEVDFCGKPQPSFNRSFELLIQNMKENEASGIENYLFTHSTKQIERFYSIFEDLNANVSFHPINHAIHEGFVDKELRCACFTDHQIFQRFHRYKVKRGFTREQALNLKMLRELQPGDFVVHIDHGIGRYSGLEKININGHNQESVRIFYKNNDILYVSINSLHKISRYVGKDGTAPSLDKIGGDAWKNLKRRTKRKIKDIAKELIKLYAKRKASEGFACQPDGYLQTELEASFLYEDTPDQLQATLDVKQDMEKTYPMDRLICGDVGFGKTEVAVRASFKSVVNGKQVAVLVPTTILALQHYKTFKDRLSGFPVSIDYVNRFKTQAERKKVYKKLSEGELDIVIGTHALLNKEVSFKDLGLLVIDEEQKFGVSAKERLRQFKVNVDTLTLTATPIPRTLQFSLMAARDLSVIRTPPPNRQPIHTERRVFDDTLIKESIYYEVHRGGQVFFVHNRVKSLADMAGLVKRLCPDIEVAMAHGQMEPKSLESTLNDFIERKYDVLVCTNIIETGLDIANANTMIINNAHNFGLSDLHQLRGRVGRSNKKAFCYLFAPPLSVLTPEARKRLKTLEEFSDLGSGFHIAMRDLDIRGAGNLLGSEQSGFIADIGYETYQRILEDAVQELKENEFKDVFEEENSKSPTFVRDVQLDADIEMLIPDNYVNSVQERLKLYTALSEVKNEDELRQYRTNLKDRFGPLPGAVLELFNGLRLEWAAKKLGFDKVVLRNSKLRCFFIANAQSAFYETPLFERIMGFISTKGFEKGITMKQTKSFLIMTKENVGSLEEALEVLGEIEHEVDQKTQIELSLN